MITGGRGGALAGTGLAGTGLAGTGLAGTGLAGTVPMLDDEVARTRRGG
jgi:hypothetical protein